MEDDVFDPSLVINIKEPSRAVVGNWYHVDCSSSDDFISKRTAKLIEITDTEFKLRYTDECECEASNIYPLFLNGEDSLVKDVEVDKIVKAGSEESYRLVGQYCYLFCKGFEPEEGVTTLSKALDASSGIYKIVGINPKTNVYELFYEKNKRNYGLEYACPAFDIGEVDVSEIKISCALKTIKAFELTKKELFNLLIKLRKEGSEQ